MLKRDTHLLTTRHTPEFKHFIETKEDIYSEVKHIGLYGGICDLFNVRLFCSSGRRLEADSHAEAPNKHKALMLRCS